MQIAERFRKLRKTLGYKQTDFGKFFSLSQDSISAIETGRNKPTIKVLQKLREDFDVNIEWLILGNGSMFSKDGFALNNEAASYIPILDNKSNAEYGKEHFDSPKTGIHLPISYRLIDGFAKEFVKALEIIDDSMQTYLNAGDFIVFVENYFPGTDGVYVINRGGNLIVKRIAYKTSGNIIISSDNPNYPPEEITSDKIDNICIIGKTVWKLQRT
jgi:transcriptional regulator with XRE-family HTH domain